MDIKRNGGFLYFSIAVCLFIWQITYLIIRKTYQLEYVYNQIYYMINIIIVIFLGLALWLFFFFTKKQMMIGISVILLFTLLHIILIVYDQTKVNIIRSLSPDSKHTLLIKENKHTEETRYFRVYYQLFAREKDTLPYQTIGDFSVKWLADDVAAVTYKAKDNKVHQYIGTYGYRGDRNYKNVGPTLSGKWISDRGEILVDTEGIHIRVEEESSDYSWEEVVQFGTLAVVLVKNDEAKWTISLDENFRDNSNSSLPPSGNITLYKADFSLHEPIQFQYSF